LPKEKGELRKLLYHLSPKEGDTYGIMLLKQQTRIQRAPTDLELQDSSGEQSPATPLSRSAFRRTGSLQYYSFCSSTWNSAGNPSDLPYSLIPTHSSFWFWIRTSSFGAYFREILGVLTERLRDCVL